MRVIQQRTLIFIVLVAIIVTLSVTLSINKRDSKKLTETMEDFETDNTVEFAASGGEVVAEGSDEASLLKIIDAWLVQNNLNVYGDPVDTMYMGGTPLFDETTGTSTSRFDYLMEKFPDQPWI
jgi:hypothetical protein